MLIRAQMPQELPAVLDLLALAFPQELDVVDLVRDLSADTSFIPELTLVAEEEGALVGYALFTRARILGERSELPVLSLAPLAVAPSFQGRGIGASLVEEGLRLARAADEQAVIVLGHPTYYPRFGFRPASPEGVRPPYPVQLDEAWMVLELMPDALEGIEGVVHFGAPLQDPRYW